VHFVIDTTIITIIIIINNNNNNNINKPLKLSNCLLFLFELFQILDECRSLTGDLPDISNMLSRAMAALEDRPVLFK